MMQLLQVMQILLAKSMFTLEMVRPYVQNVHGFGIRQQYLLQVMQSLQLLQITSRIQTQIISRKSI